MYDIYIYVYIYIQFLNKAKKHDCPIFVKPLGRLADQGGHRISRGLGADFGIQRFGALEYGEP